ncbi:hypothetical protein ACE14D_22005 [Streptomyces sp. Act-28]
MKPTKVAAILAGCVMAMGVAAPAFAADALTSSDLDGAVDTLGGRGLSEAVPVGEVADQELVEGVTGTADGIEAARNNDMPLLGGLPSGG